MIKSSLPSWPRLRAVSALVAAVARTAFIPLRGLAILSALAVFAAPASADTLFATQNGQSLIKIDTATRAVTTVGSFGYSNTWNIEFDVDGTLWATPNFGASLAKVNPATGATTIVAPFQYTTISTAIDSDGTMYAMGYNNANLYRVNKTDGTMTFVGATGINSSMDAAFDMSGNLWVLDYGTRLIRLNKATGATVQTINLPFDAMSLSIDATNTAYVMPWSSSVSLYSVNLTTGASTNLGAVSVAYAHGGTFQRTGIGVNFTVGAYGLASADQPGVVSCSHWNNAVGGSGSNVALTDSSGAATTARLTYSATGAYDAFSGTATANPATNKLYHGGLFGNPGSGEVSVTVTNIPYAYYDVYVYADGDNSNQNTLSLTDGTTMFYYRSAGQPDFAATTLTKTTSTDPANPTTAPGQYQVFSNRSGSSFTLTTGGSIGGVISNNIFGFQIVPKGAPAPTITSPTTANANINVPFSYQITATYSPTSFGASSLPAGLSFNSSTGVISGTPTVAGTFTIGLSATNSGGTGTSSLTLTIANIAPPVITSANTAEGKVGVGFSYAITASNNPTSFSTEAVPPGLSFNSTTGVFSGTPTTAGCYTFGISATNAGGTGSGMLMIMIDPGVATVTLSNVTSTYDGLPKPVTVTTSPAGLNVRINYITGSTVSTTPFTNAGSYGVQAIVDDPNYTGSAISSLTIHKAPATVTLANLAQVYDGTPKSATATTSPAGLAVVFRYNGSTTPPVNAGSYGLQGLIDDPNYTGGALASFAIAKAPATIAISNTVQSFDGTPKSVSVNTTPSGLTTAVTYNGSPIAPTGVGSYAVKVAVNDANYIGLANATLFIKDTTPPVLTLPTSPIVIEATSAAGAVATFSTSALDNVDGAVSVTLSNESGSTFPIGSTTVTASAKDSAGNLATGSFTVTVQDTTAPELTVPADIVAEATSAAGTTVSFSANATDAVGVASLTYSHASGGTFAIGTTTVTVTAKDAANNTTTKLFTVTVRDTTAPVISSLTASTPVLWSANHKMVGITLAAPATDTVGVASLKIINVTSNEPDNGLGDGDTAGDIEVTGALTLNLRAERSGNGDGRIYTITVEAKDAAGNATTAAVAVTVPKSQGGK